MNVLLQSVYAGNVNYYASLLKSKNVLIDINGEKIYSTKDISKFMNDNKINQMTFISPNGEKEKLIFE